MLSKSTLKFLLLIIFIISFSVFSYAQNFQYWNDISIENISTGGERVIKPLNFRTLTLNIPELQKVLVTASDEKDVKINNSNTIISLPSPDGKLLRFKILYSPVMAKELADKFPEIRTYLGQSIDDPFTSVRFDLTPNGFHAMIYTLSDVIFIDPYAKGDNYNYISYFKKDFVKENANFTCEVVDKMEHNNSPKVFSPLLEGQLKTYRVAIAATGEYTAYFGGTVVAGLAAVVTSLNRVNFVYEREISVRMILVANNNLIIYTNASTDPYTNSNGSTMLGQNQTNLDAVIGSANYDIGHVFSTGGGGIAQLGCVCYPGYKAQGVTGSPAPVGDPFDIDYVAHEMGHQYDGNHTFNSTAGSCGGGNREPSAAYEPGSGSTIMAYAGICGSSNLQNNSDPYFHSKSLDETISFTNGSGGTCATIINNGNHNPVVSVGDGQLTIPKSTPFSLTGSATDLDNDPLTYCWEEYDLGPAGTPNAPSGNAPIFRSFNPVLTGTRMFPKLSNILNNTQTIGEILPTYTRSLSFVLVARDNKVGGGGVGFNFIGYNVTANAGPFLVTSPNTAVTWNSNIAQTVTWDVANTNIAPVSCLNVNILLSTDGGQTFPTTLKSNTPNDGSESVTLPSINNTTARIKVEAADNIFFDLSNTNFTITNTVGIGNQSSEPLSFKLSQNYPNPFNPTTMINFTIPKKENVTLNIYDVKGQLIATLINNETKTEGTYSIEFDGSKLSSGMYFYKIQAGNNVETRKMILLK